MELLTHYRPSTMPIVLEEQKKITYHNQNICKVAYINSIEQFLTLRNTAEEDPKLTSVL